MRGPGLARIDRSPTGCAGQHADRDPAGARPEGITRDNVTVRVDAVVYFKRRRPGPRVIYVQDYMYAVAQVAQTSLRSIIGKSHLDDLLSNRDRSTRAWS